MIKRLLSCILALSVCSSLFAKEVKSVGISLGSLGNPGFVLIAQVATAELKDPKFGQIETSSSQDFHLLPKLAVKLGVDLINGIKPDKMLTLVPSSLVTRENVAQYEGWNVQD
jgi:ABC-type sugar transport system substrate-binding protein